MSDDKTDRNEAETLALTGLKEAVAERDRCLEGKNMVVLEMMAKVGDLENTLAKKERILEEYRAKLRRAHINLSVNDTREIEWDESDIPDMYNDVIDKIFAECDAKTRVAFAQTSKANYARYRNWTDVLHMYVCRTDMYEENNTTIIPHSYTGSVNVPSIGTFRFFDFELLKLHCQNITTLILESSQQPTVTKLNKIAPKQVLFHKYFPCLEVVKFCTAKENLSLDYTLSDLLALPKLRVIHIREEELNFGPYTPIASVEDIRISVKYQDTENFHLFCMAIQQTVKSFIYSVSGHFQRRRPNRFIFSGHDFWQLMCSMPYLENVSYPAPLLRSTPLPEIVQYLPQMLSLKSLNLELLNSSLLPLLSEYFPDHFESLNVSEMIVVQGTHLKLISTDASFESVFTPANQMGLATDCRRVERPLKLQLGIHRSNKGPAVALTVGQVNIHANLGSFSSMFSSPGDRRVFFWDNHIHSRVQFLNKFNISLT